MASSRPRPGETLAFDFAAPAAAEPVPASAPPPSVPPPSVPPPPAPPVVRTPAVTPPAPPPPAPAPAAGPKVLTVGQLGRVLGRSLDRSFADAVWVEGEVTGARPASSGHVYLTLKDEEEEATVDVVLYRTSVTPRARALARDGARIRVRGKPTFWSPRGRLQFVADRVEPTGKGALLEALEKLKAKLKAEGLFDAAKKRPLPHEPRVVGVVTSAAGAVIHDICKVAFRRGGARILLAPAQVQGAGAAESVRRALRAIQRVEEVDVVIVGRGGGSQDDLLAFQDEQLVRDIAECRVPVVSAVGHEVDVTLVDFVADARAATPSQAAEMVVPDRAARRRLLEERSHRLHRAMHARLANDGAKVAKIARAFGDPRLLIASSQQRIDELTVRLGRVASRRVASESERTRRLGTRLASQHPRERIGRDTARLDALRARLAENVRRRLGADHAAAGALAARLDAMSPLKVLGRGYAIVKRADGRAVRDANEIAPGDKVRVLVARGAFEGRVESVEEDPPESRR